MMSAVQLCIRLKQTYLIVLHLKTVINFFKVHILDVIFNGFISSVVIIASGVYNLCFAGISAQRKWCGVI